MQEQTLNVGDPCPACGGSLVTAPVPSDEQYRAAFDKENPIALRPGMDTAPPAVRADLGVLYRCAGCRYQTRFQAKRKRGE